MKHLLILAILLIIAACILYALNITSGAPNRIKNGFTRNYASRNARIITEKDFKLNLTSLCGMKGDTLFFSSSNPAKIYATTPTLESLDTFTINIPEIKYLIPAFHTTVIYPNVYIIGSNARMLIKGNLLTGKTDTIKINVGGIVNNPIVINGNKFINRTIENQTRNAIFKIFDSTGKVLKIDIALQDTLGDAGFTYDGMLNYDTSNGQLTYVTYFLNRLLIFDTTLKKLYNASTLDTTSSTKFELKKSEKGITHKSPPLIINTFSTQFKGYIYVKSKLEADNENKNFMNSSVIDKFDSKGNYLNSFYIPDPKGGRLRLFYLINGNQLLGLNMNHVTIFNLN